MLITLGALKTRLKKPRSRQSAFSKGRAGGLVRTSSNIGLVTPTLSRGAARRSSPVSASLSPPRCECPQPRGRGGTRATALVMRASSGAQDPQNASCQLFQATHRPLPPCGSLRAGRGCAAPSVEALGEQPGTPASRRAAVLPSVPGQSLTSTLQTSGASAEHGPAPATALRARRVSVSTTVHRWPESPKTSAGLARRDSAISSRAA